jgi:hypothetical protein
VTEKAQYVRIKIPGGHDLLPLSSFLNTSLSCKGMDLRHDGLIRKSAHTYGKCGAM